MYLMQYIRESQALYPNISNTPFDVLNHILYTNGNGLTYDSSIGTFITQVGYPFYKSIPFNIFYNKETSFDDLKNCLNNDDSYIDSLYKQKVDISIDEDLSIKHMDDILKRYDTIDSIDNYTYDSLCNPDTYITMIQSSKYPLSLGLSKKYYKQYYFDNNTDEQILRIALATSKACVNVLESYIENPEQLHNKLPLITPLLDYCFNKDNKLPDNEIEYILSNAKNDIELLSEDIKNMEQWIND